MWAAYLEHAGEVEVERHEGVRREEEVEEPRRERGIDVVRKPRYQPADRVVGGDLRTGAGHCIERRSTTVWAGALGRPGTSLQLPCSCSLAYEQPGPGDCA
jgi:hypothetical protein